ncbi:hypothetical protein T492DRAFT_1146047 [Pavlovales sp. CCMP2436]|nr:hypothetical protein T492DRAFT_1146047 [Pavlovales sp. CCMP2436]
MCSVCSASSAMRGVQRQEGFARPCASQPIAESASTHRTSATPSPTLQHAHVIGRHRSARAHNTSTRMSSCLLRHPPAEAREGGDPAEEDFGQAREPVLAGAWARVLRREGAGLTVSALHLNTASSPFSLDAVCGGLTWCRILVALRPKRDENSRCPSA